MRVYFLILSIILLISCADDNNKNEVDTKSEKERDFYEDYAELMDAMRLKIAHADTVIMYGEPILIRPELYINDNKMLFRDYNIWYTIDKPMNLDSAYIDYDESYGAHKMKDSIVYISDTLSIGQHYISVLCQLGVDAGFSISKNVTVEVSEN